MAILDENVKRYLTELRVLPVGDGIGFGARRAAS